MAQWLMYGLLHVFMEWPQGLCMVKLPSCIHGMATRLMYGATRAPLMYSWNGHKAFAYGATRTPLMYSWNGNKAYVWSHY